MDEAEPAVKKTKIDDDAVDMNKILEEYRAKDPTKKYRLSPQNTLQCIQGGRWRHICYQHGKRIGECAECKYAGLDSTARNMELMIKFQAESPLYEYRVKRGLLYRRPKESLSKSKPGGMWQVICEHDQILYTCAKCGGKGICDHKIQKRLCKECGGAGLCKHDRKRESCRECWCIHGLTLDDEKCRICFDQKMCITCGERCARRDGYCTMCHPKYVPTVLGKSYVACHFIDEIEKFIGQKIQHSHYDPESKLTVGKEHQVNGWKRKPVDGFYVDGDGIPVAIEFFGTLFHGHPTLWGPNGDAESYFNVTYKTLFEETERKMLKLQSLGYKVVYAWEFDYRKLMKKKNLVKSIDFICFIFDGKLKWTEYI